jgi:phage tail-like protein
MSFSMGDALTTHNFGIQIDGVMVEYLNSVGAFQYDQDVIEYQQVSAQGIPVTKKMPGVKKAGTVTVKRGATQSAEFTQWINESMAGQMDTARKNATVIFMDYQNNPVKRYHMRNAWCHNVGTNEVTAGQAGTLEETISITYEELVIE